MRGRKPKPPHLKLISGTKRKGRGKAMVIPPALPECPSFLDDGAKAEWARVAPQLYSMGHLSLLDVMPLAAYCTAWSRWVQAENLLAAMASENPAFHGLMIRAGNGTLISNPIVNIANRAAADAPPLPACVACSSSARGHIAERGCGLCGKPQRDPN